MFVSAGFSRYDVSFFHLFNHAFFKALLFLSAGSIIHSFVMSKILEKWEQLLIYYLLLLFVFL